MFVQTTSNWREFYHGKLTLDMKKRSCVTNTKKVVLQTLLAFDALNFDVKGLQ